MLTRIYAEGSHSGAAVVLSAELGQVIASRWEAGLHPDDPFIEYRVEGAEFLVTIDGEGTVEDGEQVVRLSDEYSIQIQGPTTVRVKAHGERILTFERLILDHN